MFDRELVRVHLEERLIRDGLGRQTMHATKVVFIIIEHFLFVNQVVKKGIDSLRVEVIEIYSTPWDDFEAVDFLEVEAIEVLFLLVDALKDVANSLMVVEATIDISFVIVDEVEAVDLWKSRP